LDVVAVTDHNQISFAQHLQKTIGKKIIVGEEIMTRQGEIIGLFLTKQVKKGLPVEEACYEVQKQGGLVYIPHPFEITRKGLQVNELQKIISSISIIEVFNGRSLEPKTRLLAEEHITKYGLSFACSSDAHCRIGIGNTYSIISDMPTAKTLPALLRSGKRNEKRAPMLSYLCPTLNRLRQFMRSHQV